MLNMISPEFWPVLFQELRSRSEEVRAIAEKIKKQEAKEQEEFERQQSVKPPTDKWHRRGRPRKITEV